jgi:hypothetical protein
MLQHCRLFLLLVVIFANGASGQWLHYRDPRTPRTKDGKPNLSAPAPRMNDKPDLSGVWEGEPTPHNEVKKVLGEQYYDLQVDVEDVSKYAFNLFWDLQPEQDLLRPETVVFLKENRGRSGGGEQCLPGGLPLTMLFTPFKILQTPREIVMLFEHRDPPRQIHTDGRPLPKDPEPSWLGTSSGKWQGQTLVVETVGFNGRSRLDGAGHPRSESMRLTERYTRRDFGHMDVEMTFDDPKYYTRLFTVKLPMRLIPDSSDVWESVCSENERDRTHMPNQ